MLVLLARTEVLMLGIVLRRVPIFTSYSVFAATGDNAYVQGGALAILLAVLVWNGKQQDSEKKAKLRLEGRADALAQQVADERVAKHDAANRNAALAGTLDVVRRLADECSCQALAPVVPLIDSVLAKP